MSASFPYHLCLTHSPLVSMVFQTAMTHLKVPDDRIRSISRRGVTPAGQGVCLDDLSDEMEAQFKSFQRWHYRRSLREFRDIINNLTGSRKFIAYLPHLNRIFYQEVIAHPNCVGFLYVEEGFTSMNWKSKRRSKASFGKRLKNQLRGLWTGSAYGGKEAMYEIEYPKFRGALAISELAFQGMERVLNVTPWISPYPVSKGAVTTYVILDTSYLHRGIPWDSYRMALVAALLGEIASGRSIAIKFHFADECSKERFQEIREEIGTGILLERDFSVEDHFCAGDLLLFAVSSLGYYVAKFGGMATCFASKIEGMDLNEWIAEGRLPADFPK